jgi:hypothetical protein
MAEARGLIKRFRLNEYLAMEMNCVNFGESEDKVIHEVNVEADSVGFSMKASAPIFR